MTTPARSVLGLLVAAALAFGPGTRSVRTQAPEQGRRLTQAWRTAIVEGVSVQLVQAYFDRAIAEKIAAHVRGRLKAGAYDALDDPAEFARLLTTHLRDVNGDLHLSVRYSPEPIPERRAPSQPTAEEIARQRERAVAQKMRERKGATLIGERTLGAGNAGTMRRVDAHFAVFVPVIHTAWDGIGVEPDIVVAPEAAVERAQQVACERLAERANTQQDRDGLKYLSEAARTRAEAILLAVRDVAFDPSEAHDVTGRYRYPNSVMSIWAEEGQLIAQVEGRARRYSFRRRADGSYFAPKDRVVMRFLRNEAGQIIALDWFEGGRSSPAQRIR